MYFPLVFKIVFHVMLQLNYSLNVIVWKLIVALLVKKFTACKTVSFIIVFSILGPVLSRSAIFTPSHPILLLLTTNPNLM